MKPGAAFVGDDCGERFAGVVCEHDGTHTRCAFDDASIDWVDSDWEVTPLVPAPTLTLMQAVCDAAEKWRAVPHRKLQPDSKTSKLRDAIDALAAYKEQQR